ncbi:MAG TPA: hypothetical protein VMG08_06175 [Allosphingosinicella sp.]|nr:hypothetical protein [Allosphingosinicella sp.]
MRNILSLLLASLVLLAPAAAPAQPDLGNPEGGFADLQAMVENLRTLYYTPGEQVPGWDQGGADPDADLRAAGADRHYFAVEGDSGRSIGILTQRPLTAFAPAGWRVVDTFGASATRLDNPSLLFQMLSNRYAIGIRANGRRVRDADCIDPIANATLYEIPGAAPTEGDDMMPILFRVIILAGDGQVVCGRSEGDARRGWRIRSFTPDGHRLPELDDADERMTIVPAGPIERLVTFTPTTRS